MLDENLNNTKITKELDIDYNPEHEKKKPALEGKISEESQGKSISQLNTLCSSELASPLFSSLNAKVSSQKNNLHNNRIRTSLTLKYILNALNDKKATKRIQNIILKEATKENIDSIVNELSGFFRFIMKNKNGNYLCSDLIEVCHLPQRIKILKEITKNISEDCVDQFGTHAIQTIIKYSSSEEEYKLILDSSDYNTLFFAALDSYGSYVIQKIIEYIPESFRKQFNSLFLQLICFLSCKKYGVVCAKNFCSCSKDEEIIEQIINLIKNKFLLIATNQFGVYLIQHILEIWKSTVKINKIKEEIICNFRVLSTNIYFRKILQSMGFINNIPINSSTNQNFRNNNQNNYINITQLPVTLNNYNNNNFMNQKQFHMSRKK